MKTKKIIFACILSLAMFFSLTLQTAAGTVVSWQPSNDLLLSFPYNSAEKLAALGISQSEFDTEAIYLVNTDTDTVVYSQNADKKMYPASTTKVMTALLALEITDDLDKTKVTANSALFEEFYGIDISTAGITGGETLSMRQLLYCMLLQSANEAASIVADYLGGGSIAKFADMMNQRARELGCKNTHFVNAHGLHDDNHYTTAHDLYLITKEAMTHKEFAEIVKTSSYKLTTNKRKDQWLTTTDSMLNADSKYHYSAVAGIKTGTTTPAGRCFVSTASLDGYNYMCVILKAPYKNPEGEVYEQNFAFTETKALYQWAFSSFTIKTIIDTSETVGQINVNYSEKDVVLLVPEKKVDALIPVEADVSSIQRVFTPASKSIDAPVKSGVTQGSITLRFEDQTIAIVNAVTADTADRSEFKYYTSLVKEVFASKWFLLGCAIIVLLLIVYIIFVLVNKSRRKKYKRVRRRRRF